MSVINPTAGSSRLQLIETENEIIASCFMPSYEEEDIRVEVKNNMLMISGQMDTVKTFQEGQFTNQQKVSGSFQQSVALPDSVNGDQLSKEFINGILKVRIPKVKSTKESMD